MMLRQHSLRRIPIFIAECAGYPVKSAPVRYMSGIKKGSKVKMEHNLDLTEVEWENDPFKATHEEIKEAALKSYKEEQARVAKNRREFEQMARTTERTVDTSTPPQIKLPFDLSKNRLVRAAGLEDYVRERQKTARDNATSAVLNAGMGAALNEFKQAKLAGEGVITPAISPRIGALPFLPTWPPAVSGSQLKLTEAASNFVKHGLTSQLAVSNINPGDMDLVTMNLTERKVNLRETIVQPNAVTLVLVSSSSYSITAARTLQRVFHDIFVQQSVRESDDSLSRLDLARAAVSGDLFMPESLAAAGEGIAVKPAVVDSKGGNPSPPLPKNPMTLFTTNKLSLEEQVNLIENGGVVYQTALLNIADGWIAKTLFAKSMRQELAAVTPEELRSSTYQLFTTGANDVVSRSRLWLDATNRFAAAAFLVDGNGCIRWRGKTADELPSERLLVAMSKAALSLGAETGHRLLTATTTTTTQDSH